MDPRGMDVIEINGLLPTHKVILIQLTPNSNVEFATENTLANSIRGLL